MLALALSCAAAGLRPVWIHPLREDGSCACGRGDRCPERTRGKHPIFTAWQKAATDDPQTLQDQFARLKCSTPNLGIALGPQTDERYIVSIDDDDAERVATLVAEHGHLPKTSTGRSPRGEHLFYSLPADTPRERVKNITGIGGVPGVDLKAAGGQVVVAGRNAGGVYSGFCPAAEIAELPAAWVLAILAAPKPPPDVHQYTPATLREDTRAKNRYQKYLERAVMSECGLLSRTGEGQRNTATHASACRLFSLVNGMHLPAAWGYVRGELEHAAVATGLVAVEARQTVANAERWVVDSGAVRMPREAPRPETPRPARAVSAEPEGAPHEVTLLEHHGTPIPNAENVARMLAVYPHGAPRLNTFAHRVEWQPVAGSADGAEVLDTDELELQGWLSGQPLTHRVRAGVEVVHGGIALAAVRAPFHPVRDYLRSLTWDGVPRVQTFGAVYLGAPATEYAEAVVRCFLVGAVARAMVPGCQLDTMLVLEGAQGARKTTALRVLAGERWFSSTPIDFRKSPDCYQAVEGVWIKEIPEYDGAARQADAAAIKAFISAREDRYRPSYGRCTVTRVRGCAFVATTNATTYLGDETGARRFHPLLCGVVRVDELARDRDQLWAEAVHLYDQGAAWWLSRDLEAVAAAEADARYQGDSWEEMLPKLLTDHHSVTSARALELLGVEPAKQGRNDAMRVGAALRRLGWVRRQIRSGNARGLYEYLRS